MAVPAKYRQIGDFHEYYSGSRVAPFLTLFVGGNHEASNHLWELYYGGWVAPNIYYMGAANVVNLGSLRIAGLSGIWYGSDYKKPHSERLPYGRNELRSIYHVRELDVTKLLQLRSQVDIGISHDWPWKVEWSGDWKKLFRSKSFFESDARSGKLGSPAAKYVMDRLRPKWWFAAHLHCKFSAVVNHEQKVDTVPKKLVAQATGPLEDRVNEKHSDTISGDAQVAQALNGNFVGHPLEIQNDDEIDLDMNDEMLDISKPLVAEKGLGSHAEEPAEQTDAVSSELRDQLPASFARPAPSSAPSVSHPEAITNKVTQFLSLDKCLPNRKFLQLLEIDSISGPSDSASTVKPRLTYDKEWLAITRAFRFIDPVNSPTPPNRDESYYRPLIEAEEAWVEENIVQTDKMTIPENFEITAPLYDSSVGLHLTEHPREYTNPQTVAFCHMLGIEHFFTATEEEREARRANAPPISNDGNRGGGYRGRGRGSGGRGAGGNRGRGRGRGRGYR